MDTFVTTWAVSTAFSQPLVVGNLNFTGPEGSRLAHPGLSFFVLVIENSIVLWMISDIIEMIQVLLHLLPSWA